jgi:thymidylate synthase
VACLIEADNLSEAWLAAAKWLIGQPHGKAVNLNVVFTQGSTEVLPLRRDLDDFLAKVEDSKNVYGVETVANTIFPQGLYHPHLGERARTHLYRLYALSMEAHRRRPRDRDTYFNRLVSYPGSSKATFNQLDHVIDRLASQMRECIPGPHSSAYEIGLSDPLTDEFRIQVPGADRNFYGFPCLSHISLTLERPRLHLTATYRNQFYVARAYGNYLGLARLGEFIAAEIGGQLGEVMCVATHADVQVNDFGRRRVEQFVADAHRSLRTEVRR